jgi:hypothetical protein
MASAIIDRDSVPAKSGVPGIVLATSALFVSVRVRSAHT